MRWFGVIGGLLGGVALGAISWLIFVPPEPPRLVIEGYEYAVASPESEDGLGKIADAIDLRTEQLLSQEVAVRADEQVVISTARELGYGVNRPEALQSAREGLMNAHVTPGESLGVWLMRRFSSTREAHSLALPLSLDRTIAERTLTRLAAQVEKEPKNAQMIISEHKIIPSEPGRKLSVAATAVRMESGTFEDALLVEAALERLEPRVTEEQLAPVDVTRVLATYETSFRGKAGPRAINIRRAGRYLDGAIILPGEVLSFNDQVGRRIPARGFVDAPVILNDELELDVGGGVCQVATTLHAAAIFGNLEIVRRRSHSRPSGYAPLGLDATVIDGKVDLQIRNPYDEPLLVHVSFPSTYVIRVEVLGRDPDVKVEHAYSVTGTEPFARRVWHKDEVPLGGFEQKQKGSQGMDVVSVLRIKHEDGTLARRTYSSKYYPVPEVFWMGEGASPSDLPALPEDAAGVVIDGEEPESTVEERDNTRASQEEVPSLRETDDTHRKTRAPVRTRSRDTN